MKNVTQGTLALTIALTSGLAAMNAQSPVLPHTLLHTLNEESKASNIAGIQIYSEHLVRLLVPEKAGTSPVKAISDRLVKAELLVRQKKEVLISEDDIAGAFNDLMKRSGAPDSLRVDSHRIHEMRAVFQMSAPDLITAEKNGILCRPGESVFLTYMLIKHDGIVPEGKVPPSETPKFEIRALPGPNSSSILSRYVSQHSQAETLALFDELVTKLHI